MAAAILILEDEPSDQYVIRRSLESHLNNVLVFVENSRQAMDYLAGIKEFDNRPRYPFPVLMILDLKVPGGLPTSFLHWCRHHKNESIRTLPIVALTQLHEPEIRREILAAGADGFFLKPFNFQDFEDFLTRNKQVKISREGEKPSLVPRDS